MLRQVLLVAALLTPSARALAVDCASFPFLTSSEELPKKDDSRSVQQDSSSGFIPMVAGCGIGGLVVGLLGTLPGILVAYPFDRSFPESIGVAIGLFIMVPGAIAGICVGGNIGVLSGALAARIGDEHYRWLFFSTLVGGLVGAIGLGSILLAVVSGSQIALMVAAGGALLLLVSPLSNILLYNLLLHTFKTAD